MFGYLAAFGAGVLFAVWLRARGDWGSGLPWERTLMLRVHELPDPQLLDFLMLTVPWIGTHFTLAPLVGIALLWMAWRRAWYPALHLFVVEIGAWTANPSIKRIFGRPRPELWEWRGQFAWSSYASGHAIATIAVLVTAAVLLHRARGWWWPFWVVAIITAITLYSRLYLGVHWPTDVIGGALIGVIWLWATLHAFPPARARVTAVTAGGEAPLHS